MKPPRPSPPRTLVDPPPPLTRSPQTAATHKALPTLAALVASGVVIPGCHDPECGSTRADEIAQHGPTGVQAARSGRASEALHEIGVALGVVSHESGSTGVRVQGGETSVTIQPITHSGGVAVPVQTTPAGPVPRPTTPTTTEPHPDTHRRLGGVRRRTTPEPPTPPRALRGDMKPVGPDPLE